MKAGAPGASEAVDLVGGDVQEAEGVSLGLGQCGPVGAGGLQQRVGAFDVGAHEGAGAVDGAVDMALGGEVHDGARAVLGQQAVDQGAVADVAMHEDVACVAAQALEVAQVAGVGERIEVEHGLAAGLGAGQPVEHEVAADEAGAAGDEGSCYV